MKRLTICTFFLIMSCQTKSTKPAPKEPNPTPTLGSSATVTVGSPDVCVRIENCSTGIDVPKTCGAIQDKIIPGSEGCKLKLVSFPYRFPDAAANVTVNLSPEERDRLANAKKDEGIETHISVDTTGGNKVRYTVSIKVVNEFPEKPTTTASASFHISYNRQGNDVAITDIQVKTADSDFLKACLRDRNARVLNAGEKNLLTLIKSRYGVTCRDMHAALSLQDELIFFNSSDLVQALDFNILAEFKNITRLQIDGFYPITLVAGHKYDELTFGARQVLNGGPVAERWLFGTGTEIKKLIFDHVRFPDRSKAIKEYIVFAQPAPATPLDFKIESLVLKNVVHQNFAGLDTIGLNSLAIENTYLYDDDVFVAIKRHFQTTPKTLLVDGYSDMNWTQANGTPMAKLDGTPITKISDAICKGFQAIKECMFNQCIFTKSATCTSDFNNPIAAGDISIFFSGLFCDRSERSHWEYANGANAGGCKRKCEGSNKKKCGVLITRGTADCTWDPTTAACYTTLCSVIKEEGDCTPTLVTPPMTQRPQPLPQCTWNPNITPMCQ